MEFCEFYKYDKKEVAEFEKDWNKFNDEIIKKTLGYKNNTDKHKKRTFIYKILPALYPNFNDDDVDDCDKEEEEIYEKILDNKPVQYTDYETFIDDSITVDASNFYAKCLRNVDLPIEKPKKKLVTEIEKYGNAYYLCEVDLDDLPPFLYQRKQEQNKKGKAIWWLHNCDVRIFTEFNKYCTLVTKNVECNCYKIEKYVRCAYKLLKTIIDFKTENKSRVAKEILNYGIGYMQKSWTTKNASNNTDENTRMFINNKGDVNFKKKNYDSKFFRIKFSLYPYARMIVMMYVKQLYDKGIKIYRIATDSITCEPKGKEIIDTWISKEAFKGFKYEAKNFFQKGYLYKNQQFNNINILSERLLRLKYRDFTSMKDFETIQKIITTFSNRLKL